MAPKTGKSYIESVGRRKTAVARTRLVPSSKARVRVNERELAEYFPTERLQNTVEQAFTVAALPEKFQVTAKVTGGGISAQAEAVRHGIARALVKFDNDLRGTLKREGFLKRDPREKERRKFGLKKARKRAQWSKR